MSVQYQPNSLELGVPGVVTLEPQGSSASGLPPVSQPAAGIMTLRMQHGTNRRLRPTMTERFSPNVSASASYSFSP
jgi:hypothetical protein